MKYRQRLLFVGALVAFLICWAVFVHRPGFRKHERHESIHMDEGVGTEGSKEDHPTLTVKASNGDVLPVKDEFHHVDDSNKSPKVINIKGNPTAAYKPLMDYDRIWKMWKSWPTSTSVLPEDMYGSQNMSELLIAMSTAPIHRFDVGYRGTQLKVSVTLEGGQVAVFKPRRYKPEYVVPGEPISGFDRHDGEIAAFHLDGILGFNLAPPVVGRTIDLYQLLPVTTKALKDTYFMEGTDRCFYGVCHYCKPSESVCGDGEMLEGSLTIWLPSEMQLRTWAHPFRRTYRKGVKAPWELSEAYCVKSVLTEPLYQMGPRLLDIIDTTIFDFLIDNADRHHYETFLRDGSNGRLLHLDNGKGFRNPLRDELSILAPLTQCCRVRHKTWNRLQEYSIEGGRKLSQDLASRLKSDPLSPVLHPSQVSVIDKRLKVVVSAIEECFRVHSQKHVLR